ncbi:hypothetical protein CJJ17_10925 [Gordonia polyisoprenivorans]|nr:hypothetical protein CJJ17_10925 [Gordonia polyisoprenivorans]
MIANPSPRWSRCEPRAASLETRRDRLFPNHIERKASENRTPYHTPPTESQRRNTLSTSRIDQNTPCVEHPGEVHWRHRTDQPPGRAHDRRHRNS